MTKQETQKKFITDLKMTGRKQDIQKGDNNMKNETFIIEVPREKWVMDIAFIDTMHMRIHNIYGIDCDISVSVYPDVVITVTVNDETKTDVVHALIIDEIERIKRMHDETDVNIYIEEQLFRNYIDALMCGDDDI